MKKNAYCYGVFGSGLMALLLMVGASPSHAQAGKADSIQGHAVSYTVMSSKDAAVYNCLSLIKEKKEADVIKEIWVQVPRNEPNSGSLCEVYWTYAGIFALIIYIMSIAFVCKVRKKLTPIPYLMVAAILIIIFSTFPFFSHKRLTPLDAFRQLREGTL